MSDTNDDLDKYDPPVEKASEKVYSRGRNLLPLADLVLPGSGTTVDFFADLIGTPYARRQQEWQVKISAAIKDLLQNRGITMDNLRSNDEFVSILIQATQAARRTHQQEKIEALSNATINTADGINISFDLKQLFVHYIDELTPSHITLLAFLSEHETKLALIKSYELLFQQFNAQYPQTGIERDEFKLLCSDLSARILLRISAIVTDFTDVYDAVIVTEGDDQSSPYLRVTDMGRKLLAFVRERGRTE